MGVTTATTQHTTAAKHESLPTPPGLGHPVPDVPHAVSVQLPKWQDTIDFAFGRPRVRDVQRGGYPRSFLHEAVIKVHDFCVDKFANGDRDITCFLFPAGEYARIGKNYLCSPPDGKLGLSGNSVRVASLDFDVEQSFDTERSVRRTTFNALFLPKDNFARGLVYWRLTGCGISSRLAEDLLKNIDSASETPSSSVSGQRRAQLQNGVPENSDGSSKLRQRIVDLLERSPIGGPQNPVVRKDDVYTYATGMAAIHHLTQSMIAWPGTETVIFGFPYELSLKITQDFAKGCTFYGFGTSEELVTFENQLKELSRRREMIQAVWCECASNPLLRTVDLNRIHELANQYGFVVIVDETIGSFANVDLLGVADVIVTSLTKSFSGLADVMGGSIVVNPRSRHQEELHKIIHDKHVNTLYGSDAIKLYENSLGFLPRAELMNRNATYLVDLLSPLTTATNPSSPLQHVYYPKVCWSKANYVSRMRPATEEFTPGYGGLFTLEFINVEASSAFFNALNVCKGPSLGAEVTLAQPYVQTVFAREKEWAKSYGLSEAIVRISAGVENHEALGAAFLVALKAAGSAIVEKKV